MRSFVSGATEITSWSYFGDVASMSKNFGRVAVPVPKSKASLAIFEAEFRSR